ncbi:regulator of G-protein signaling 4 [Clupea harengus]|uniref:Regulator of G-protein signaling 4 n=1 Tax=Clupea harengus TaxID=7950 RepID=A0A6P3W4U5_CLUHA|nr:regulator of G-protein signaling 4 [Clupea harengus]
MCKGLTALPATCLKSAKDIKHRIENLLQNTDFLSDLKAPKKKKPVVKRENPIDIEKWKSSFNNVINNEVGLAAFKAFLKSEFSQENIAFWMACEEYKKTSADKMAAKAKQIFDQYVEMDSPGEVNLDSATREETRSNLLSPDVTCFDEAQSKIVTLMETDSYRRFLKSKLFLKLSEHSWKLLWPRQGSKEGPDRQQPSPALLCMIDW